MDKEHRYEDRPPRIPRWLALIIFLFTPVAWAEPFAQFVPQEGVRIVLHDENCRLTDQVVNLGGRATWEEGGKVYEGCFDLDKHRRLVRLYFSDKTVIAAYMQEFKKVSGI